jgi:hypothetical protein
MFTVNEPLYKATMEQHASNGQDEELSLREISKRRQITSANVRLVCSTILLIPTCGTTSVGILLALARRRKAQKKYNIVVNTMQKHGIKMPKHRKRDRAVPVAVIIGVYMATFGIVWGLDHVFSEAAMYMLPYGYVPVDDVVHVSGVEAAHQFIASPDLFVQGMVHGGAGTLDFATSAATQNMNGVVNDLVSNAIPFGEPLAYVAGEEMGSLAMIEVIRQGVSLPSDRIIDMGKKVD